MVATLALAALVLTAPGHGASAPVVSIAPIGPSLRSAMTGVSWRPGCPVALRDLRVITARHVGFDGRVHTGRLIVHRDVAADVARVLRRLYAARFPIRRMVPIDAYGASDFRSIEADNTSAFNCRYVDGTTRWSEHAYGRAVDLNPIENPYVQRGTHVPSREHPVRRPYALPQGHGVSRQLRGQGVRGGGLGVGRRLVRGQGLPALLRQRPLERLGSTTFKRAAGFEPATSSLEGWRSTN